MIEFTSRSGKSTIGTSIKLIRRLEIQIFQTKITNLREFIQPRQKRWGAISNNLQKHLPSASIDKFYESMPELPSDDHRAYDWRE